MSGMPVHHANAFFVPFARFLRHPSSLRRRRDRSRSSFLLLSLSCRLRRAEVAGAGSEAFLLKAASSAGSASLVVVVVVPGGGADTEAPGCSSRGMGVPEARFAELRRAPDNEWQTRLKPKMLRTQNGYN